MTKRDPSVHEKELQRRLKGMLKRTTVIVMAGKGTVTISLGGDVVNIFTQLINILNASYTNQRNPNYKPNDVHQHDL